jgi:hypothetical protein
LLVPDSRVAPIVSQMRTAFKQRILNAALGPDLSKTYGWPGSDTLIDRIIAEQPREWLPKDNPTYADLYKAAYEDARQTLMKSPGPDESQWTWGISTKCASLTLCRPRQWSVRCSRFRRFRKAAFPDPAQP